MKVFYNEKCTICRYEINQYKAKSTIIFRNCSEMGDKYLRRLHLITDSSEVKIGLDAFVEIWRKTPGCRILARTFSLPIIYQIATIGYEMSSLILFYRFKLVNFFNEGI